MAAQLALPSVEEVDAVDEKLGSFLSDLDDFASRVQGLVEPAKSLEDCSFLVRAGIAVGDEAPSNLDPAVFARLLVFADELLGDAQHITDYAAKMGQNLLWIHREVVLDPATRRDTREEAAGDA